MAKYIFGSAAVTAALGAMALLSSGLSTWEGSYGIFACLLGILFIFGALFGALIGYAVKLLSRDSDEREREDYAYRTGFGNAARGKGTIRMGALVCFVSVVWFIAGLAADRVYVYPPILLVFGLISIAKGYAYRRSSTAPVEMPAPIPDPEQRA